MVFDIDAEIEKIIKQLIKEPKMRKKIELIYQYGRNNQINDDMLYSYIEELSKRGEQ